MVEQELVSRFHFLVNKNKFLKSWEAVELVSQWERRPISIPE